MRIVSSVLVSSLILASAASAQKGVGANTGFKQDVATSLIAGNATATPPVAPYSGGQYCVGVCRDKRGDYWVSCGSGAIVGNTGVIAKFDKNGVLRSAVPDPAAMGGSTFGIRDLAYDSISDTVYGGAEVSLTANTIYGFDPLGNGGLGAFDATRNVTIPAAVAAVVSVTRGLAVSPDAGGNPVFFCCTFGSTINAFTKAGVVLGAASPPPAATGVYGLAYNYIDKKLWLFSQNGSTLATTLPSGGVIGIENDVTGLPTSFQMTATGVRFVGDSTVASTPAGGIAGGCEFAKNPTTGDLELTLISQATADTIYDVYATFEYGGANCGGRVGMSGDAPYAGNNLWTLTLSNSLAVAAVPVLGLNSLVPFNFPPLGAGCFLNIDPVSIIFLPTIPVTGGTGSITIAIPTPLPPGSVSFQWVEPNPTTIVPLRMSTAGHTKVGN